jgi:hypothetical protein
MDKPALFLVGSGCARERYRLPWSMRAHPIDVPARHGRGPPAACQLQFCFYTVRISDKARIEPAMHNNAAISQRN